MDESTIRATSTEANIEPTDASSDDASDGFASTDKHARLLIDAVDEYAIFMLDQVGTVVTWNAGAQRIKGYTSAEILGQHFSIFYTSDDISADKPQRELAQAIELGQCHDEGWRVRKDGERFWANVTISALFDPDGRLEGFAKVTKDETVRKQAEQHIRELELLTDRERIARDLHDTVVHRIYAATLAMQGALKLIADPVATERIENAIELLDETLNEIRIAVLDLTTDDL